jgi:hypothetical protein
MARREKERLDREAKIAAVKAAEAERLRGEAAKDASR